MVNEVDNLKTKIENLLKEKENDLRSINEYLNESTGEYIDKVFYNDIVEMIEVISVELNLLKILLEK